MVRLFPIKGFLESLHLFCGRLPLDDLDALASNRGEPPLQQPGGRSVVPPLHQAGDRPVASALLQLEKKLGRNWRHPTRLQTARPKTSAAARPLASLTSLCA